MNKEEGFKWVVIFILLTLLFYNILPIVFSALQGQAVAGLSILLAIITQQLIGEKVLRYLK